MVSISRFSCSEYYTIIMKIFFLNVLLVIIKKSIFIVKRKSSLFPIYYLISDLSFYCLFCFVLKYLFNKLRKVDASPFIFIIIKRKNILKRVNFTLSRIKTSIKLFIKGCNFLRIFLYLEDWGEDLRKWIRNDLRGKYKENEIVWIMVYYSGFVRKIY